MHRTTPPAVLGRRTLNRALLDRQLLLSRAAMSPLEAVGHLLGLQSQAPHSAYPALWTRLDGFAFADLSRLLLDRAVVRIALMRGTVHLVRADDALLLRPLLQPLLDRQIERGTWGPGVRGVDRDEAVAACRALVEAEPRTPGELRELLGPRWPDADPASLVNALRNWMPLVQVPPRGVWGIAGRTAYTTAESWLGRPPAGSDLRALVRRYLAAFGPASVADAQKWSGLTGLRQVFAAMELRTYRDENGRVLYDAPDAAPLPDPDLPVAARFVADFDNLLLSHADRSRILAEEHVGRVMTANGIVRGTVLVDGFVAGTWSTVRERGTAAVAVVPFASLRAADRATLEEEGRRLLAASDPEADRHDVRFA
ncbi:winged helix DNA-binding domain-containing protein [Streptomyces sp. NPDC026673]|uniref:winged helix DNA-binding domain-containing protein n=1 Tax=Streptomyces sp. NPDC026673 TaxID=3155724 RepID=UPI0033CE0862